MKEKRLLTIIGLLIVVLAIAVVPFMVDTEASFIVYFLFMTFCYITISQAWNLVGGYTGQMSMGQHAFFGLGAYTTGIIWLHNLTHTGYYFDPVTMILSGLVPVVLAILIGIPLLSRLRGDYFALGTLGMGQIIQVIFVKGGKFTGASDGLHLPSTIYSSMRPYYWTGLILAIVSTALVYFMTRSRIGLALRAIREDETAAAAHGVHVLGYKIFALGVSAFLCGLCGSLYGIYLFHINPDSVIKLDWTLYPILMCVIGGAGSVLGPVIGALFMTAVFNLADIYLVGISPIFAGILIVIVMKFMPGGLAGLTEKMAFARRKKTV
ncbi:MAG: branched-chain amino acid ABC transporter permease [Syntrophorhabdales bacterium]|jgi:branched-chain amino acid transport system permease protein